jgi:hypothetical protein
MRNKPVRNIGQGLVVILLVVGVVTAASNITFGGFTPSIWLILAGLFILLIIGIPETSRRIKVSCLGNGAMVFSR